VLVIVALVEAGMDVRVAMASAVGVGVFVLVEDDFDASAESVGDAAECLEAGHVIAAFQTRNHGLGHAQAFCEGFLGLARLNPELLQTGGAVGGESVEGAAGLLGRVSVRRWVGHGLT